MDRTFRDCWGAKLRAGEIQISEETTLLQYFDAHTGQKERALQLLRDLDLVPPNVNLSALIAEAQRHNANK